LQVGLPDAVAKQIREANLGCDWRGFAVVLVHVAWRVRPPRILVGEGPV